MNDTGATAITAQEQPTAVTTHAEVRPHSWLVPTVLGVQAAALTAVAAGAFGGIGVGSTALRVGVGVLFVVLAAGSAGIAVSYSEGQPSARTAAFVFEGFVLALTLLWLAPIPSLVAAVVAATIVLTVVVPHHLRRQIRRPVPSQ